MPRIPYLLVAVVTVVGVVAAIAPASERGKGEATLVFVTTIPPGHRDWRLISVAHESQISNDSKGEHHDARQCYTTRQGAGG
jgi:hypothetical protein